MDLLVRGGGIPRLTALTLAFAIFVFAAPLTLAQDGSEFDDGVPATPLAVTGVAVARETDTSDKLWLFRPYEPGTLVHGGRGDSALHAWLWEQCVACRTHGHGGLGYGTLGYDRSGLYTGFYGFGLSFHLGYGYGGKALGVGAFGGDPFYGGPGYPSCSYGRFSGVPAPLVVDPPVALEAFDRSERTFPSDYGPFTGAIPYPETLFAPYAAAAASTGSSTGASSPPPRTRSASPPGSLPP
jgi:hypothetical protein